MHPTSVSKLLAGAAITALFAASHQAAIAADVVGEEPPIPENVMAEPAPIYIWSGPYAGIALGYGFGESAAPTGPVSTDGFLGSGFAGYNYQTGPMILGLEGDAGYSAVEGTAAGLNVKSGFDGSLRARMGFAVTDDVLVYGTAGGAAARMKVSDAAGSDSQTLLGWAAGAGVDAMLTDQIFGRAEYRYSDFGSEIFNTGSGAQSVDATQNRIQLGVGLKF